MVLTQADLQKTQDCINKQTDPGNPQTPPFPCLEGTPTFSKYAVSVFPDPICAQIYRNPV